MIQGVHDMTFRKFVVTDTPRSNECFFRTLVARTDKEGHDIICTWDLDRESLPCGVQSIRGTILTGADEEWLPRDLRPRAEHELVLALREHRTDGLIFWVQPSGSLACLLVGTGERNITFGDLQAAAEAAIEGFAAIYVDPCHC
jgi:hypothetical protein